MGHHLVSLVLQDFLSLDGGGASHFLICRGHVFLGDPSFELLVEYVIVFPVLSLMFLKLVQYVNDIRLSLHLLKLLLLLWRIIHDLYKKIIGKNIVHFFFLFGGCGVGG